LVSHDVITYHKSPIIRATDWFTDWFTDSSRISEQISGPEIISKSECVTCQVSAPESPHPSPSHGLVPTRLLATSLLSSCLFCVILGGTGFKTMFLDVKNVIISTSGISTVHFRIPECCDYGFGQLAHWVT
jgi:hypothetical protein